jgi:transcriptional regulator with XRE-family HTH domain
MRTFAERLLQCIADEKTSQAEVARKAGITAASMSDWAKGKAQPSQVKAEPLLRAAAFLKVNPMWLLLGRGQRDPATPTVLTLAEPPPHYKAWPFDGIDPEVVSKLTSREIIQIEGAWLLAAKQLGFSLAKPGAA